MIKKNHLLLLTASACSMGMYAKAENTAKPNIILLFADDLGWNDISSPISTMGNGSKNHQTPNIDKLATQSMVFTNAYTQQNSAPTRAALLTGQYANRTHVYNVFGLDRYATGKEAGIKKEDARIVPANQEKESIKPGTLTYARLLNQSGYNTYIFGKVHGYRLTENDNCGFSHDFECSKKVKVDKKEDSNYYAFKTKEGEWIFDNPLYNKFAQPYTEDYIRKNLLPFANGNNPLTLAGTKKHFTDAIADVVIDEIAKVDKKKPFSMWVSFHAIHSAIVGREDLYAKYKNRTELDERHENFKYGALTEQLDQTVGRILAAVDDPNGDGDTSDSMRDNTVVIFMSDNGGVDGGNHSNAPLRWAKGTQYEGGIRVPMMVRFPKMVKPNTVTNEPVHVIDFLPTFLELAGVKYNNAEHVLDGESFVPLLTGKSKMLKRDRLFWHFPGYMDERGIPASVINKRIGDKRYKYRYCYEYDTHELYNITDDIGEKVNLLSGSPSASNLKIGNELLKDLNQWIENTKPLPMYYVANGKQVALPKEIKL
jgi:arylsulfatase A-like enzyme